MRKFIVIILTFILTTSTAFTFSQAEKLNQLKDDEVNVTGEIIKETTELTEEIIEKKVIKLNDTKNHWAEGFIAKMVELNFVSGYPDGNFRPNDSISVSELSYKDKEKIDKENIQYIATVSDGGILTGYPNGKFNPKGTTTRGEACTIIAKLIMKETIEVEKEVPQIEYTKNELIFKDVLENRYLYQDNVELFATDSEATKFTYNLEHNKLKINRSTFEIFKRIVPTAIENDLFAYSEPGSVKLYRRKSSVSNNENPLYEVVYFEKPFEAGTEKDFYALVKVTSLQNVKKSSNETIDEVRQRLKDIDYKEEFLIESLRETIGVVINPNDVDELLEILIELHDRYRGKEVEASTFEFVTINTRNYYVGVYGVSVRVYIENPKYYW